MWFNAAKENLNSATFKFIHIVRFVHIWAKRRFPFLLLLRNAEFSSSLQKLFLTGIEASGLTVILPSMEQGGRGERS